MNTKTFKKIMRDNFKSVGYSKNNRGFFKDYGEFYLKFDLQKSNYSNGWYINYSVVLKELHPKEEVLESNDRDSMGRVIFTQNEEVDNALLEIEQIADIKDFQEKVWKPIHDTIIIFETGGIRNYIHQYPKAKYSFNLWAQEYLQKKGYLK